MSAVFEAVGDLVEGVVDVVGDAVEWVGDTVGNVVEAAMDDPLKAIAQVAVIAATGGAGAGFMGLSAPLTAMQASLGLAAIEGVDVLEEGGDLGDALEASAKTFAVSQAVSFGMDAFSAAGPTGTTGSATTQFFDDGTSIQFFDDGSRLVTDTAGAVSSTPATDLIAANAAPEIAAPAGPEAMPVNEPSALTPTELPPIAEVAPDVLSPENIPLAEVAPQNVMSGYDQAMADVAAASPQAAVTPVAMQPDAMPVLDDAWASQVARDRQYGTIEDLMYDRGLISDAQYKEITGMAPVVDLSQPAVPMSDKTFFEGAKDLGGAAFDYAMDNKLQTLGILGAGAALAGAGAEQPQAPGTPPKKTYTYGEAPKINRSGLQEIRSAAAGVYGRPFQLGGNQTPFAPTFQSSFQPNLGAEQQPQAGIGTLPITFQQIGGGETYDISKMTPEDIIRLQDKMSRSRKGI